MLEDNSKSKQLKLWSMLEVFENELKNLEGATYQVEILGKLNDLLVIFSIYAEPVFDH